MPDHELHKSQGLQLLKHLLAEGKRIFSIEDFLREAITLEIPKKRVTKIVSTLARQGWLVRVRRGLYIANDTIAGQITVHPYLIAMHLVEPSVISHWSAAQHHGLTEQAPHIISASTTKKIITPSMRSKEQKKSYTKHMFEFNDIHYEFITIQKNHLYGIEIIWIDEYSQVQITDKERTILDLFAYPKMFGGIREEFGILESSLKTLDLNTLVKYTIKYGKKSIAKRLGWGLETMGVDENILEPLLNVQISYFCRLDPSGPAKGKCDKRWMIQDNLKG